MKKLLSYLFVASLMLILVACGNSESSSNEESETASSNSEETSDGDKLYIPVIPMSFQHQFWQAVNTGAEMAAEEFGVEITFEGPEDETQIDKQIDILRAALDKNPDAIAIAAIDSQAAIPLLEEADEKGIPVIAFDTPVDSDIPVTTAATDNYGAASLAAEKMAELLNGKGKVAVISYSQTSQDAVNRRDGFVERIEQEYPDIEIVDIQYGDGDHLKSTDLAKAIMQAHPDLDGFFGTNEGSAIGILNAVKEMNKENDLVIIGFDSGQQQIDAIKEGIFAGSITQNPIGMGYETVKAAVQAIKGEELPETIDTGFYWYDKDNIDDEEISAVLYE